MPVDSEILTGRSMESQQLLGGSKWLNMAFVNLPFAKH